MGTRTLSIRVSDEAALNYETASEQERRKLDALLTLQRARVRKGGRSLEEVMSDLSRKEQERGLTPEILDEILDAEG